MIRRPIGRVWGDGLLDSNETDDLEVGGPDDLEVPTPEPEGSPARVGYFKASKSLVNSLLLVTPVFVLYQLGILTTDGWRNGADFVTSQLFVWLNGSAAAYLAINVGIVVAMVITARLLPGHARPTATVAGLVVAESVIYATFMGGLINWVLRQIGLDPPGLSMSVLDNIVLSLGAGAYEELVFRLLLLTGLFWLGKKLGLKGIPLALAAFAINGVIFSAFHYPPFGGDEW
ncbi:MAG: CPBP family intramembrane metalloprotease, partial [Myxococcales bacterium]|nr:CPBP family intramembrane metalloprotease [Myxococcales bacterium]